MSSKEINLIQEESAPNINYNMYSENLGAQTSAIQEKINNHELKLVDLEMKEQMLNRIIMRTNAILENIEPSNFKWIGQTQANLMKQIENLGLLKDIIIKYEDMIFKYRRVLLENNEKDLGNRLKINTVLKEEEVKEDSVTTVLNDLQLLLKNNAVSETMENDNGNALINELKQELLNNDY